MKRLELNAGGHIAFEEYGDARGVPVFFCHGWPNSLTMAELTAGAARELGVRIISLDRPGIAESALQPNRKLADWPPMLQQLANHLGIDQFRLLAISGGAPYAYATAHAMARRVSAVAIVSGAPPIADLRDHSGLLWLYRWMLAVRRRGPKLLEFCFRCARPFAARTVPISLRPLFLKLFQPGDASALRDNAMFDCCFGGARRAWRGPVDGILIDAQIYAEPWGFRLEEIEVPVRLWHGKADRAFSFRIAEEVAARLPNCKARIVDQAGHFSLPIRFMREILADLISS